MLSFVVALFKEAEQVITDFSLSLDCKIADKPVYVGEISGKKVSLIVCGIGKVNAAMGAQIMIDKFSPEYVINFGTAGGADNGVKALNYYVVDKCCQYDFDLTELDPVPLGYIQEYGVVYFNCRTEFADFLKAKSLCTADRFSNKPEDIKTVKDLKCALRDMEGAAIAEVCTANGIPFISVKGVTDTYENPSGQFYENLIAVCKGFSSIILNTVRKI